VTQQFPSSGPATGRRTNIGPFGLASLGVSLAAAIVSLCGIGGLATPGGFAAMLCGFVCFYINRETGSKRDLVIGISGMVLGFLISVSSVYFGRTTVLGLEETLDEPSTSTTVPDQPGYRAPGDDPFASPKNLPEPTRPATQNRGDEGQE
jgi:hypothetical protein